MIETKETKPLNKKAVALTAITITVIVGYVINFILGAFVIPESSVWATITLLIFLSPLVVIGIAIVIVMFLGIFDVWIIPATKTIYKFWNSKSHNADTF